MLISFRSRSTQDSQEPVTGGPEAPGTQRRSASVAQRAELLTCAVTVAGLLVLLPSP